MRQDTLKPERSKTIASGRCPECRNARLGVVRQGDHLLWREHTYTTWSGAKLTCRASGVATCVAPERFAVGMPMHMAVLCPHTRDARPAASHPSDPSDHSDRCFGCGATGCDGGCAR